MTEKTAVIIGGGPAGLTAAYELLVQAGIRPVVIEATNDVGGISRTINHHGNRIDIGGHRFFSKSDRVVNWWLDFLPLDESGESRDPETPAMMVRSRVSRILYGGKLFQYPLSLSPDTVRKLGLLNTVRFGLSYLAARLRPIRQERSLEDFLINRFGRRLYARFFEEYTEKVWGVPCNRISAEWGAQRIKGLSITKVLKHALRRVRPGDVAQKGVETSLIERFMYPKLGPGQLWQTVAERVAALGGEVRLNQQVTGLHHEDGAVCAVTVRDAAGATSRLDADLVISTMPIKHLVAGLDPAAPAELARIADGLVYRDFLTVGLLVDRIELGGGADGTTLAARVPDNWIYVQEPGVKLGRIQIFNNWSPHMVADPTKVWIGLEYFCNEGDDLWEMDDEALFDLAVAEVTRLGLIRPEAVRDRMAYRMPKAYPAYFGTHDELPEIRRYVDGFSNLYLVGRNGMHRYNNQDHSMLTAMAAVDAVLGKGDKAAIWSVNTEQDYHEAKRHTASRSRGAMAGQPQSA